MNYSNKKPKILLLLPLPPPFSGVETLTQFFLQSPLKFHFDLLHVDSSNKRSNEVRGKLDITNILMTAKNGLKLVRVIIQNRPELANIPIARNRFGFFRDGIYILVCSLTGAKVVSRMTGDHFDQFYRSSGSLMKLYIRLVLNNISRIIVRGDRIRKQFHNLYPNSQVETVYLPFDPKYFNDVSKCKKLSSVDGVMRVLFMGHISKAKGAFDLMLSIPMILERFHNVKFLFAGNIIQKEYNIRFIENSDQQAMSFLDGIELSKNNTEYLGVVTGRRKKELLKSVDILVLPSYSEGFPFVALEAMAAGLPVVATPVGALPEIFRDRENILFVPIGDPKAIAHAIVELLECKALRSEMGKRNKKVVRERFNLDVFSERMTNIFSSLL
jgi:glycosyltransferase involved in cell wall biosynthesis